MVLSEPSKPCKKLYKESKAENVKRRQTITIQETRIQEQETRIQDLERRLAHCNNANTPPSHDTLSRRARRRQKGQERKDGKRTGGPRGAPAGHSGATGRPGSPSLGRMHQGRARGAAPAA